MFEFILDKPDPEDGNLDPRYTCKLADGSLIELGRYRVMYGYRLRGGYVGDGFYDLDICCGDGKRSYRVIFESISILIRYNLMSGKEPFFGIPNHSKIKPYHNDPDFMKKINNLLLKGPLRGYQ